MLTKCIYINTLLVAMWCMCVAATSAQTEVPKSSNKDFAFSNRFGIVFGLVQPIVARGFNVEATYYTKRMSFDYSHGMGLHIPTIGDAKNQKLAYYLPYSTGFGIGYRFTEAFNVRFEPKAHQFNVYYADDARSNTIIKYTTYTLGLGAYYRYMPFKNMDNWLKGITLAASVRYWLNVASSLKSNQFSYYNRFTEKTETLKAANIGIANTPLIINLSVGYTFGKK